MSSRSITSVNQQQGILWLLVRLLYFVVFGLWFSGVWATIAWVLSITIIGLPIGLWMLNKLPQVSTLQPERHDLVITTSGKAYVRDREQHSFLLRAVYFVLVGWWLSALWLTVAWALSASIIGLPFAFWMFNRVPAIITLART
jgi:uncharacterized membrane protein YccF (DUF307 family)